MVAANPVFAGVAYFNNPALFDGIIDDDLVIRETFEAGDSASRMDKLFFATRLSLFDSTTLIPCRLSYLRFKRKVIRPTHRSS